MTRRPKSQARKIHGNGDDAGETVRLAAWEAQTVAREMTALYQVHEDVAAFGSRPVAVIDQDMKAMAARVAVAEVQRHHAVWSLSELRFEVGRALPPGASPELVRQVADLAVTPGAGTGVLLVTAPEVTDVTALGTRKDGTSISSPGDPARVDAWLTYSARRGTIAVALNLVPFAGIAFLWFIGVVRDRIGQLEDRFFGSVFFGSGLLFVAMLFAAAAVAGAGIADEALQWGAAPGPDVLALGRQVTGLLLHVYAMRMAGVFTMSAATILLRTRVGPRWIAILGIAVAAVLLVSVGLGPWVDLLFPAWILLLSIDILRTGLRRSASAAVMPSGAQA
jgi:hypothetical protein